MKTRRLSSMLYLLVLFLGLVLITAYESGALSPVPTAAPAPTGNAAQPVWYQVFFTTPKYPDKQADHHGGLDEKLSALINTAQKSVDVAIYQLDLENVTQALVAAKNRGATVRVATDIDILNDPEENASFKALKKAGITVVGGNSNAIMHDKFVVVDAQVVWTGSWNFTENDTYRYNNDAILIRSPELARNYTATMNKMFVEKDFGAARKPGGTMPRLQIGGVNVENYFAPEDRVAAKILPRLQGAMTRVDFMAYSFTDDDLGSAILDRAESGVKVSGVFETSGSETRFSEYGRMKEAGLDVWQDGNNYLMHHKVFIVDGRTVVFGSFNFSASADTENDENLLIVDDAGLAQAFEAEFGRVYSLARTAK